MTIKRLLKVGDKSFMVVMDDESSITTGKFIYKKYKHPVKTIEIGDDLVIYYESKTDEFIGFSKT